jgi:hypothetical protein
MVIYVTEKQFFAVEIAAGIWNYSQYVSKKK